MSSPSQVPTRRNGAFASGSSDKILQQNRPTTSQRSPPQISTLRIPFLPTSLEAALLAIYPSTLLLGSLFSLLDPSARAAPYSAVSQSHPANLAPSYFAQKKNFFNVFFVKIGWFWTTLAFFIFLFTHPSTGPSKALVLTPPRLQAALRWGLLTLWWTFVTQWFFGPPMIDRGFRLTGGQCELLADPEARAGMTDARKLATHAACKAVGGKWFGGHDISGHVFLLVLGSGFLWMEILPVILRHAGLREERLVAGEKTGITSAAVETQSVGDVGDRDAEQEKAGSGGVNAPLVVAGLSWWMLLMTAAYFHTWFEKFTGLMVAFVGIFTVYFLPRAIPSMRAVIGMPGV
ncbi:hypothetical protein MMC16_004288 [Acarospora aff. strigata]|nr:hypothetical protein [Acarospora aff. strigata]